MNQARTVEDAIRFLESLKPRLNDLIRASEISSVGQAQKIQVTLNSMDVMKLEKEGRAHVLWVGPKDGNSNHITDEGTDKFRRVCGKFNHCLNEFAGSDRTPPFPQISFIRRSKTLAFWLKRIDY